MKSQTFIDTRAFDPRAEQALVLSLFDGLKEGENFEILMQHDPLPLFEQMDSFSTLKWQVLESKPSQWLLKISKLSSNGQNDSGCCGVCGG